MKHRETIELNQEARQILESNQLLHDYSRLRNRYKRFLNKAIRINQTGEPFSFMDFNEIDKKYFKNLVFHLRHGGFVRVIDKTSLTWYGITGFKLKQVWEKRVVNPTGVPISNNPQNIEKTDQFLLEYLNELDYPALHNIRLHFRHENIHKRVEIHSQEDSSDIQYSPANRSFTIKPKFSWETGYDAQIIVTPRNLVQVIIKNTFKPIPCDENGIKLLITKLEEVRNYISKFDYKIPTVGSWLFVRADFGRDCKRPLNKIFPEMQFRDLAGSLIRLYAKPWSDGVRRARLEKIITPNMQIKDLLENLLNTSIIQKIV